MIAFALAADIDYIGTWGRMSFFLFVTITSWILVIAVFVLLAFNLTSKINLNIDWNIPVSLLTGHGGYAAPAHCTGTILRILANGIQFTHKLIDPLHHSSFFRIFAN